MYDFRGVIREHRKLWTWISIKTFLYKRKFTPYEYIAIKEINLDNPYNFCCVYKRTISNTCKMCPLKWGESDDCKNYYYEYKMSSNYIESYKLAKKIALLESRKKIKGVDF